MDACGAAADLFADSGVPESQPMEFSLCPGTQTFFREPYRVNQQFSRSPAYTTTRPVAVRPIPMSPVGDPSYIPPPATTFPVFQFRLMLGILRLLLQVLLLLVDNFNLAMLRLISSMGLEPLPDSSPERAAEAAEPCDNRGGGDNEELEGEGDSDSDDSDECKNTGNRTHWQTMALIEAQKELWRLNSTKRGREKLTAMKDKAGRKKEKLLHKFLAEWRSLLDSFQSDSHVNNPLCVESSSAPTRLDTDPVSDLASGPETSPPPADSRSGVANAAAESGSRSNTGVKRKKDASRSASLLVEAIDRMSENNSANFEKLEKRKNEREVHQREMIRELESICCRDVKGFVEKALGLWL
ncbi:hypothetical protein R1sor_016502 [Riccia sorocarpa]|uniref:Uncharacterized protein n=1 Tax=Riccia sorocarpa TaxID=122646 RepID=A0ABD3HFK2_9MARC